MAGRQFNENNANVPSQDSTDNMQEQDVVGNKTDTAATPSSTTSVVAIIKKIHDELITLADSTEIFAKSGPDSVEIDDDATYGLGLYDVGDDPPTTAEITPGNYQIDRIRDGALTNIVASTPASEATGRIYASEIFAAADWAIGDLALITFSGGSVTTGTTTTTLPNAYFYTRVSREESIEGKLGTFPTTYNNISRSTLTDIFTGMFSLFGANGTNVFNPTINGSARTTMEAALNALASYSASGGAAIAATVNPGGSSRASLELILEDFADMWAGSAGIITYPAGVAAGNGVSFAEALRYASEAVDVIDGLLDVPAQDAVTDTYMREVVGKKNDTAQTTVGTTRSTIAYAKGALNQLSNIKDDTATLLQKTTKSITLSTSAPTVTETLFTVTGEVECYVVGYIDTAVTSGGALTLEVGISGDTAGIIAQTAVGSLLIDLVWINATPATLISKPSEKIIANGANIVHTISTAAATAGAITYYCWWRALSSDGNVASA